MSSDNAIFGFYSFLRGEEEREGERSDTITRGGGKRGGGGKGKRTIMRKEVKGEEIAALPPLPSPTTRGGRVITRGEIKGK